MEAIMSDLAAELLFLEQELQVPSFSNDDALMLGLCAVEWIKESGKPGVYIVIKRGASVLFTHCMKNANEDNRLFAERKIRTVEMFEHSSMYAGEKYKSKGRVFESYYDETVYQCKGGAFPICIPGTGMVGVIGISGLSAAEDHEVSVMALRKFVQKKQRSAEAGQ